MGILNSDLRLSGLGGSVRPPAVAGTFYPADASTLARTVAALLDEAGTAPDYRPKALIVPHAGYVYSGPVAASGYGLLREMAPQLRRVVLLGPAHRVALRGLAVPGTGRFRTPLGDIAVDRAAVDSLRDLPQVQVSDTAHAQEHSLEVHLPFLQTLLPEFSLVPVVVGRASAAEVAAVLERLWGGPETLIVISTDLSHYHDYDTARRRDERTCIAISAFRFEDIGPEDACGCMPMSGLLLEARRRGMEIRRLDLRNSGDTAGTRDRVVGYAAFALGAPVPDGKTDNSRELLELARRSIAHGLNEGRPHQPDMAGMPATLRIPAAAFVTLQRNGRLRGCIGTTEPVAPLAQAVADSAFKAAFRDPRFPPLAAAEFHEISISVSILGPKEPVVFTSEEHLVQLLRPGVDGLVIARGERSATFLPSVWDSLPAPAEFLAHLKRKAGLAATESPSHAWRYTARYVSD